MCFVWHCTQNELIIDYLPLYPYKVVLRVKFTVSICKSEVWTVQVFYPYNRTVQTVLYGYGAQPY